jgi:hypothetical protein
MRISRIFAPLTRVCRWEIGGYLKMEMVIEMKTVKRDFACMSEGRASTTPLISSYGLILAFRLALFSLSQAPDLSEATQSLHWSELRGARYAALLSTGGSRFGVRGEGGCTRRLDSLSRISAAMLEPPHSDVVVVVLISTRLHVAPPPSLSCLRPRRM